MDGWGGTEEEIYEQMGRISALLSVLVCMRDGERVEVG
jgi:hypothetical protein